MGDNGGTTETTPNCARDGEPTRLRRAECQAPICPRCFVRTPVGLRCPDCAVASGPPPTAYEASTWPRWLVPVGVVAVLAVALAGAMWIGGRGGQAPAVSDESPQAAVATQPVRLGSGSLPHGGWSLDARRGDGICVTLSLTPGSGPPERCYQLPGNRGIALTTTMLLGAPPDRIYLTLGVISERTERVLVAPEGQTPWEVPALGAGANLGGRLFVANTTSPVTTFTALAADGSELGHIRSAPPTTQPG